MVKQLKETKAVYIITIQGLLPHVRDATASIRGIKEILVWDKTEEATDQKEIRWSIEMKYNVLMGKPPGWGALPDWEISPTAGAIIPFNDGGEKGTFINFVRQLTKLAVVLTHQNLSASILQLDAVEKDIDNTSVVLCSLPYYDPLTMLMCGSFPIFKGL